MRGLTPDQQDVEAATEQEKAVASYDKYVADQERENTRYRAMIEKVEAWEPPTTDHTGLKDFMLQQLRVSISGYEHPPPVQLRGADWYAARLSDAIDKERRAMTANIEEIERTESRNKWLRDLRESLA